MKLSFKLKPKMNSKTLAIVEELSFHTTKLYNTVNFNCRNNKFTNYIAMNELYSDNWHKEFLHSHNYQQCLKVLEQNWKSFFAATKDYGKNPEKYKAAPKPPNFKNNKKKNEIIFTNLAIRVDGNIIKLSLSKKMQDKFKVKSLNFNISDNIKNLINVNSIQQIKINWENSTKQWSLIIVYNKELKPYSAHNNLMSIDLGLGNLATLTFLNGTDSYIINGKAIKSANSYYNKEIAKLQSIRMKQVGSPDFKDTKKITALRKSRNNFVKNYMHKASRIIINIALSKKVSEIIIGDISGIKQNSDIKSFVQVPIQRLVQMIEYKAALEGIVVYKVKEHYTSGTSSLDLEPIDKHHYNKSRRIKRGLFKSEQGIKINADVNGSLNILRKHLKDTCIPELIKSATDNGFVNNPSRIRVI